MSQTLWPSPNDEPPIKERHRIKKWIQLALFPTLLRFMVDDLVNGAMYNGDGFSPTGFSKKTLRLVPEWEILYSVSEEYDKDIRQPFSNPENPLRVCEERLRQLRTDAIASATEVFGSDDDAQTFLSGYHDSFLVARFAPFCAGMPRLLSGLRERSDQRTRLLRSPATKARKTRDFWTTVWNRDQFHWAECTFGIDFVTIEKQLDYLLDPDVTIHDSVAIVFADAEDFSIDRLRDLTNTDTFDKI